MANLTLTLELDPESEADMAGFRSLKLAVKATAEIPEAAWRVCGGWMVRAWAESVPTATHPRLTVDVDLALDPPAGMGRATRVLEILFAELHAVEEPFRLQGDDGVRIDVLIAPGGSRRDPPKIGEHEVFEAPGTKFAFRLPPVPVTIRMASEAVEVPVPTLAAALVSKAVVLGKSRPLRARDDARDVALLLQVARVNEEVVLSELHAHKRRNDVRAAIRALGTMFEAEESQGSQWVSQELDKKAAFDAILDSRSLVSKMSE